jgi:hypothetical protein
MQAIYAAFSVFNVHFQDCHHTFIVTIMNDSFLHRNIPAGVYLLFNIRFNAFLITRVSFFYTELVHNFYILTFSTTKGFFL